MPFLADLTMYARFASGLRAFLQTPMTAADAQVMARQRLAEREQNFLRLLEHGVWNNPRSPYTKLLQNARCEFADVAQMTRTRGVEDTLRSLRDAGVYITFEEFKGREPIVRPGLELHVTPRDFDNPYLKHYYYGYTGGSTGAGTRVPIDLDSIASQTPHILLTQAAHGLQDLPRVIWLGIFPDSSGMNNILRLAPARQPPARWFTPLNAAQAQSARRDRLALRGILTMSRLSGFTIPSPETVPLDNPLPIVKAIAELTRKHGGCVVSTQISKALRICLVAHEQDVDLTGVIFWSGGEPPTPAKVKQIHQAGATHLPGYWITELGTVAMGCANPSDENDLHLFHDDHALIAYPRAVPNTSLTVDAFHFTTLNPAASKLMLNVESDDYGIIETRACGCPLESYGFHTHLREIRSYRKLTGEGVTLVGSEMIHILEEVLPSRFGGSLLDYQLVEEEDERGFTRLNLLVSPRLELQDEAAVTQLILDTLGNNSGGSDQARAIWQQAQTLQVQRREPIWTARGKLMPLHLGQRKTNGTTGKTEVQV